MKKIGLLLLICLTSIVLLQAQEFREQINIAPTDNFYTICTKADAYFSQPLAGPVAEVRVAPHFSDGKFKEYQRWKWYWHTRVDENGNFPDLAALHTEADAQRNGPSTIQSTTWTTISQTNAVGGYNGMGRTTCMAYHPTNPNEFYVGAPIGGLWKTTDGGVTYTPLTDALPYVSVGSCLIDPTNPLVMYISVGDHSGWWNYSLGVYKTTDGGVTWAPTGLSWTLSQGRAISKLEMDPLNPQLIFAATTNGLYKTSNGGTNWNVVRTGDHSDIEFEPGTSNVYVASYDYWGSSEVYRSIDNGTTWTALTTFGINYNHIRIAVTPANPAKLAIQCSDGNNPLYISTTYGTNSIYISDCPENDILIFSPTDQNKLYCGAMFVFQSTDNGTTWNQLTYWYYNPPYVEVHADQRNAFFNPINPAKIYFCNDGGVYTYNENTAGWADLSDGLIITQFYKIANSQTDPMMVLGGTQDNGGRVRMSNGNWRATNGGDAMQVAIDPTDDDVIYTTYVNGLLYRSLDRWFLDTYYEISTNIPGGTPNGSWITPYMIDPSNSNTIVAGYDEVWRTTDRGDNWTALSTNLTGGNTLECLAVAPSDPNTIYCSYGNTMFKTTNMGGTWTPVVVPNTVAITSITVHPTDPNRLWITRGGYTSTYKVQTSINGGFTWTNISTGLPNVSINTGIYETGSANLVYIGTDAGVYYRDTVTNTWTSYGTGLPKTSVTDLHIYYPTRKLRAATYGRGIWEVDLVDPLGVASPEPSSGSSLELAPNPAQQNVQLNYSSNSVSPIEITVCNLLGETVLIQQEVGATRLNTTLNVAQLPKGYYTVSVVQNEQRTTKPLIVN